MQSFPSYETISTNQNLKQIKVDNWGTFFLQRLLQLYFNEKLLDLKIKFCSTDDEINVHKLVMATCTDYFVQLKNEKENIVTMPADMPYECVKSIVSFIYTGQLEYWTGEQTALYSTAKKMNITILTKLLDAQEDIHKDENSLQPTHTESLISDSEKYSTQTKDLIASSLNTPHEQKFYTWTNTRGQKTPAMLSKSNSNSSFSGKTLFQNSEGPSRFDLPEIEDSTLGVFSSFDDITYNTKPILRSHEKIHYDNKRKNIFTNNMSNQIVMIQDESNHTEENVTENNFDNHSTESESILKFQENNMSVKRKRYNYNEKENQKGSDRNFLVSSKIKSSICLDNHAKIVREVLKKYPHLIQNKNIRLKIMQKESKSPDCTFSGKTKVSYAVLSSESLKIDTDDQDIILENYGFKNLDNNDNGPWKCDKCDLNHEYTNYSMYRRHVQDVHGKKFDPRICEYCGFRATKRNILMYHMYTKHNISIQKNMSFPKCHNCSYVALSESLLIKHQMSHKQSTHLSESMKYDECREHSIDGNELICQEVSSKNRNTLTNSEKESLYSSSDELFVNNLKSHLEPEKNSAKNTFRSNSPTVFQTLNVVNIEDNFYDTDNFMCKTYKRKYEINQKDCEKINDLNHLQKSLVSQLCSDNQNIQTKKQNDCFSETINKSKFGLPNFDENMVIYIDNVQSKDSCRTLNDDEDCQNKLLIHNKSNGIEKVIEKVDIIENNKQQIVTNMELKNLQVTINENDATENDKHNVYKKRLCESKETIQYVEEETEILEYETCNTA